jgi:hypothetical protein
MADVDNKKVSDKEFVKNYGKTTVFSYGCSREGLMEVNANNPRADMYVYRMTTVNSAGDMVEYTPDFMRYRCEQMNVKTVPVLDRFIIPKKEELEKLNLSAGEYVKNRANVFLNTEPDPIGKTHIKEGVVVRILNRPYFTAYKDKVFEFKVIEGIAKDCASQPDMEEAEECLGEEN